MSLKYVVLAASCLAFFYGVSQQGGGGSPKGYSYTIKKTQLIEKQVFDEPNIKALEAEDKVNDELAIGPWRFGYNYETFLGLNNSGTWINTTNGDKIWFLEIESTNAKTINLTFSNSQIPEGNELYVYNKEKDFILGKFESKHLYKGSLGTELVPGSSVIVEYFVPKENFENLGNIEISRVTHGYRSEREYYQKAFGSSGSCNMNVNCPDGSGWLNQRNSVLMLVSGGNGFCSAALINNTEYDGTPYVLTANHCFTSQSSPASWVFRFQWQADDCINPESSPSFESLSGAVLRARRTPSDFCLVEITGGLDNGKVPESYKPYFAGWNSSNTPPFSTVSIHHPTGDIKKISFDDNAAVPDEYTLSTEPSNSWRVVWDRNTTTEGGSSGSPLFDQEKRIVGQLWGGGASCGNLSAPDFYGRLHNSWNPPESTSDKQLKHWLDPNDTGKETLDGYDPYFEPFDNDIEISQLQEADGIICTDVTYPVVTIKNIGLNTLTSAKITFSYNDGDVQTINWTGNLSMYEVENVPLPYFLAVNGNNSIHVVVSEPNGVQDQNLSNNEKNASFKAVIEGERIVMDLTLDCFAQEISWRVEDDSGYIWYSGGGYTNQGNTTKLVSENFCLIEGCYELIVNDTEGDGLYGSGYNNCEYDGNIFLYRLTNGDSLVTLTKQDANFGSSISLPFCAQNTATDENQSLNDKVEVFPNPTNGEFKVQVKVKGLKVISLIDYTGKLIATKKTEYAEIDFNEKLISSGVYLLKIKTLEGVLTRKIVIY